VEGLPFIAIERAIDWGIGTQSFSSVDCTFAHFGSIKLSVVVLVQLIEFAFGAEAS
jgi:hypothetical protein